MIDLALESIMDETLTLLPISDSISLVTVLAKSYSSMESTLAAISDFVTFSCSWG